MGEGDSYLGKACAGRVVKHAHFQDGESLGQGVLIVLNSMLPFHHLHVF